MQQKRRREARMRNDDDKLHKLGELLQTTDDPEQKEMYLHYPFAINHQAGSTSLYANYMCHLLLSPVQQRV